MGGEQSKEASSSIAKRDKASAFGEYMRSKDDIDIEGDANFETGDHNVLTSKTSKRVG
jgi:hypothetical protein